MEVAIGEYGTDTDILAEAAKNKCNVIVDKKNEKTGKCFFKFYIHSTR